MGLPSPRQSIPENLQHLPQDQTQRRNRRNEQLRTRPSEGNRPSAAASVVNRSRGAATRRNGSRDGLGGTTKRPLTYPERAKHEPAQWVRSAAPVQGQIASGG